MCEHLPDTTLLEILKNNDYGAKGFLRVIYCGKITPSEYHSEPSKGNKYSSRPPPAQWQKDVSKKKKVKVRSVLQTTRCPDENNHRGEQTIWTAGTKDFLWENSVASFHFWLLFALSEKYVNEQWGDWSREHENEPETMREKDREQARAPGSTQARKS